MEQTNVLVEENISEEVLVSSLKAPGGSIGGNDDKADSDKSLPDKVCHTNSPRKVIGDWHYNMQPECELRVTREAEAEKLAEEHRLRSERTWRTRRQEYLKKFRRIVLEEDDPESLAIEATNEDLAKDEEIDPNWPPARPHKKRHGLISAAEET